MRRALLLPLTVLLGCVHSEAPDPSIALRSNLRALSSENAWLHARLAAATDPTAIAAIAAQSAREATATTRAFSAVRQALAGELRSGQAEIVIVDGTVDVGLPAEAIGFAGDSALPSASGARAIERIAAVLRRQPDLDVDIATQVTGAPVVDLDTWQRAHTRALAIAWALTDLGVGADRVTVVSRPTISVPSGTPASFSVPRQAVVDVVLRPRGFARPEGTVEQGPLLGVVR